MIRLDPVPAPIHSPNGASRGRPTTDPSKTPTPGANKRKWQRPEDQKPEHEQPKKQCIASIRDASTGDLEDHRQLQIQEAKEVKEELGVTDRNATKKRSRDHAQKDEHEHQFASDSTRMKSAPQEFQQAVEEQAVKTDESEDAAKATSKPPEPEQPSVAKTPIKQLSTMKSSEVKTPTDKTQEKDDNGKKTIPDVTAPDSCAMASSAPLKLTSRCFAEAFSNNSDMVSGDVTNSSSAYPSLPSSKGSPPGSKRSIEEVAAPETQTIKKTRSEPDQPELQAPVKRRSVPVVGSAAHLERDQVLPAVVCDTIANNIAPTVPNMEVQPEYAAYDDDDNIPVLLSATLLRHRSPNTELLNNPSLELKVEAVLLLERGIKAHDMGRAKVARKGPTVVFEDCDLYLRNHQLYVATEPGLLLVADYLKLNDVPETTKVRFNGVRSRWMKTFIAQKETRRVHHTTSKPDKREVFDHDPINPGFIGLQTGYYVEVYGFTTYINTLNQERLYAYGRSMSTKEVGKFEYEFTSALKDDYIQTENYLDDDNGTREPEFDGTMWEGIYEEAQKADLLAWYKAEEEKAKKAKEAPVSTTSTRAGDKVAKTHTTPSKATTKAAKKTPAQETSSHSRKPTTKVIEQPLIEKSITTETTEPEVMQPTAASCAEPELIEPADESVEEQPASSPAPIEIPAPSAPRKFSPQYASRELGDEDDVDFDDDDL